MTNLKQIKVSLINEKINDMIILLVKNQSYTKFQIFWWYHKNYHYRKSNFKGK